MSGRIFFHNSNNFVKILADLDDWQNREFTQTVAENVRKNIMFSLVLQGCEHTTGFVNYLIGEEIYRIDSSDNLLSTIESILRINNTLKQNLAIHKGIFSASFQIENFEVVGLISQLVDLQPPRTQEKGLELSFVSSIDGINLIWKTSPLLAIGVFV